MSNIKSARNYFFEKLIFPKVITIDRPGYIITRYTKRYGDPIEQRSVFHFEDILANIQIETIKKIGKEKSSEIWYDIGKDTALHYLKMSNIKKIPRILLPSVLEYIFTTFKSVGTSMAENISFDKKNCSLILYGSNNPYCRKSNECNLFAGATSGFLSLLSGENIEAKGECENCPKNCKIVANRNIIRKFSTSLTNLSPSLGDKKLNFPMETAENNRNSLSDFIRFKKINIDNSGKFYFKNKILLPSRIGAYGIVVYHYNKIGEKNFLKKTTIKESSDLFREIIVSGEKKKKLKFLTNLLSATGWGIISYNINKEKIVFNFKYPPTTSYGFEYYSWVLNGFLNTIFNKELEISKTTFNKNIPALSIVFS